MSGFKKQYTKPLPDGAEIITRKGERIARWHDRRGKTRQAPVTTGEDGTPRIVCECAAWYGRHRDHDGLLVERSTGCKDEQAARQVLVRWEKDVESVRGG